MDADGKPRLREYDTATRHLRQSGRDGDVFRSRLGRRAISASREADRRAAPRDRLAWIRPPVDLRPDRDRVSRGRATSEAAAGRRERTAGRWISGAELLGDAAVVMGA